MASPGGSIDQNNPSICFRRTKATDSSVLYSGWPGGSLSFLFFPAKCSVLAILPIAETLQSHCELFHSFTAVACTSIKCRQQAYCYFQWRKYLVYLQLLLVILLDLFLPQLRPVGPGLVDAEQRAFFLRVPARRQRPVGDAERRRAEGEEDGEQLHPRRHLRAAPALERVVHVEERHARRHRDAHREQDPPEDAVEHHLRQLVVAAAAAVLLAGGLHERLLQEQQLLLLLPLPHPLLLPLLLLAARLLVACAVRGWRADAAAVAGRV